MRAARTFIGVLDALLNGVCRLAEYGAPDLGMNGHQGGKEADFALRRFGGSLVAVRHELQNPQSYSVTKRVQPRPYHLARPCTRPCERAIPSFEVVDPIDAFLGVLDDLREQERERACAHFCGAYLVERTVVYGLPRHSGLRGGGIGVD